MTKLLRTHLTKIAALIAVASVMIPPTPVDAQSFDKVRQEYRALQTQADNVTDQHVKEQGKLGKIETQIEDEESEVAQLEAKIGETQKRFDDRARQAYLSGPSSDLAALWEAGSIRELSLRLQVMERQGNEDETLMLAMERDQAERQRVLNSLERKRQEKASSVAALRKQRTSLEGALSRMQVLYERLDREERERLSRLVSSRQRSAGFSGSSSKTVINLQACPAAGANSFSNDWGAPRGGGRRRHKGNDIFAANGSPAAAVVAGRISRISSGGLGGLSIYLRGNDGNEYFYTHMSGFATSQGQSVAAGQTIAYVGNTGNARGGAAHIHFEIHPGGGAAINPYFSIIRVC